MYESFWDITRGYCGVEYVGNLLVNDGTYLMNSACILSGPAALSFPNLFAILLISAAVKGFFMGFGGKEINSFSISGGARVLLK